MKTATLIKNVEHWDFRKLTRIFLYLAIIVALVTSWLWYRNIYMSNERRFWMAINNSMATPSVVRTLSQGGTGNLVVQDYRFHYSPQMVVQNRVNYTEKSATTDTNVQTEGIVYPGTQYLRYTAFSSKSVDNTSTSLDQVLGQWAEQPGVGTEEQARLDYVSELVTLVIFGNFDSEYRQSVLRTFQEGNVYGDGLSEPFEDTGEDGERVLTYQISVDLKTYTSMLNESFMHAGYGEFPALNPENYREGAKIGGAVVVRKKDNTIVRVSFGGREETYSNYGVIKNIERPEATQTVQELQTKVESLIQI